MTWDQFIFFAIPTILLWISGAGLIFIPKYRKLAKILSVVGILIFFAFIIGLWIGQSRPPLRTMGETRLWYSFFIAIVGLITYYRWRYSWLLSFSNIVATVFIFVNLLKPEIHSTNLMPALQSYWFIPHVTVYILSYAMLGAATITSFVQLRNLKKGKQDYNLGLLMDNLVYLGLAFLLLGMLMGALWAKEAWGHYWSWDPKETWAFITSCGYLLYIHLRVRNPYPKFTLWMISLSFILLMITWVGVNYLPAAQGSVHVYS